MTDIVDRLQTVDISWSQEGEWCAEAADEIIKLREDKKLAFELMDTFVKEINRMKQVLRLIANMTSDPEFGVPPIATAQKIAQDALEKE
jgi:hypothetical protein